MSKELDHQLKAQKEIADKLNSQTNERNVLLNGIFDLYKQRTELEKENRRLQEQIDDLMGCLIAIRDRGCEKDFDCILSADITLQKWGVK